MKQLYKILMLCLFIAINAGLTKAQTTISYTYDNAGNRLTRTIKLTAQSSAAQGTLKSGIDSTYLKEENKEGKFNDQINEQKINIYPNPTHGALRVEITNFEHSQQTSIRVYNLKGGLVATLTPLTGNDIVDLSASPLGIYVLKIQLGDKVSEWKVVKE